MYGEEAGEERLIPFDFVPRIMKEVHGAAGPDERQCRTFESGDTGNTRFALAAGPPLKRRGQRVRRTSSLTPSRVD